MPSRRTSRRIRSALHMVMSDYNDSDVAESTASTRGGSTTTSISTVSCAPKPIYIYPGLLRIVRHSAIALDARCPASIYKPQPGQVDSCAICLDHFHARDLIRRLPCNKSHIFHSLCLLKWLKNNDRCPLCMDTVSAHPVKRTVKIHQPHLSDLTSSNNTTRTSASTSAAGITSSNTSTSISTGSIDLPCTENTTTTTTTNSGNNNGSELKVPALSKQKKKGPRTYSYIVHDAVRMQVDLAG